MRRILATIFSVTALFGSAAQAQESNFPTSQELTDQATGVVARYGDWEIRCSESETDCRMFQVAQDDQGNNVVSVTMQILPEDSSAKLGVVMVSPLLTLLPRGLSVMVNGGVPAAYPFSWCEPQGCFSRFGLTAAQVEAFEAGDTANIDIFAITAPEQPVQALLSLSGFTEAVNDLGER
ncbi:MAG: invasion associated locus B family protein [Rhodobacteraceae bacterium]|nr:invasion associated locus B family protein [Paracoccaceae bacterium]